VPPSVITRPTNALRRTPSSRSTTICQSHGRGLLRSSGRLPTVAPHLPVVFAAMYRHGAGRASRVPRVAPWARVNTPSPWRRAALLTSTVVGFGLAGHALAGGTVDPIATAFAFVPLLMVVRVLGRRERNLAAFVALLIVGQIWVHLVGSLCGHAVHDTGATMLVGHGGAALLAAVILRRHEAGLWARARGAAVRGWVIALVEGLPDPQLPSAGSMRTWLSPSAEGLRAPACALLPTRRGPPAVLAH
jgi:hypothetical protein